MQEKQVSIQQKEDRQIVNRKRAYLEYLENFPLYSTLMVLEDYEKEEQYEECAIIRDAIEQYRDKYKSFLPENTKFPTNIKEYKSDRFSEVTSKIDISERQAKEKATIIKLNLPL